MQQTPTAIIRWTSFSSVLCQSNYCSTTQIDECYLGPMWSAHIASIDEALPLIWITIDSRTKTCYWTGWTNLIDFISRSRKSTNLIENDPYQDKSFPSILLTNDDHSPYMLDLTYTV